MSNDSSMSFFESYYLQQEQQQQQQQRRDMYWKEQQQQHQQFQKPIVENRCCSIIYDSNNDLVFNIHQQPRQRQQQQSRCNTTKKSVRFVEPQYNTVRYFVRYPSCYDGDHVWYTAREMQCMRNEYKKEVQASYRSIPSIRTATIAKQVYKRLSISTVVQCYNKHKEQQQQGDNSIDIVNNKVSMIYQKCSYFFKEIAYKQGQEDYVDMKYYSDTTMAHQQNDGIELKYYYYCNTHNGMLETVVIPTAVSTGQQQTMYYNPSTTTTAVGSGGDGPQNIKQLRSLKELQPPAFPFPLKRKRQQRPSPIVSAGAAAALGGDEPIMRKRQRIVSPVPQPQPTSVTAGFHHLERQNNNNKNVPSCKTTKKQNLIIIE